MCMFKLIKLLNSSYPEGKSRLLDGSMNELFAPIRSLQIKPYSK